MAETKYIVFQLDKYKYGIKLAVIKGIENDYNIVPIPVGADNMRGIIHLRGDIVPLFDLKKKFQLDNGTKSDDTQLLIAETHGIKLGLEVDAVIGILPVEEEDIKPVPKVIKTEETDYIENIIKIDCGGKPEIVLSVAIDNIMSDVDFENVSRTIEDVSSEEE
ncbi:MAG: chemotaxis protein CheW [Lachnospiraceae bacterium]|nr:chemotaxis protein CheW [Lachnospiraceae bacterium]